MKLTKLLPVLCLTLCAVLLSGCSQSAPKPVSNGYLPEKIEDLQLGGRISADTTEKTEASLPAESLWGQWVPETELPEMKTMAVKKVESNGFGDDTEIDEFPKQLAFLPCWMDNSTFFTMKPMRSVSFSNDMNDNGEDEYENTILGQAAENAGLYLGRVEYDVHAQKSDDLFDISLHEGEYAAVYTLSGDTLALGLTDLLTDDADAASIIEVDYQISFTGYRLTLTYGKQSVTYVPSRKEGDLLPAPGYLGIEKGYEAQPDLIGMYYSNDQTQIYKDAYTEPAEGSITLGEDGTVGISGPDGEVFTGTYLLSDDMLTLTSGEKTTVYSSYRMPKQSSNKDRVGEDGFTTGTTGPRILVNGVEVCFYPTLSLQELLDQGLYTDADLSAKMIPGVVSPELKLTCGDGELVVKIVDPWETSAPLSECLICYARIDKDSNDIRTPNGSRIGVTDYETVSYYYAAPYEQNDQLLKYKVFAHKISFDFSMAQPFGRDQLNTDTTKMEVSFNFSQGILSSFEIDCPEMLYSGLQDNVSAPDLGTITQEDIGNIVVKRDDILVRLKEAFEDAGVDITIDPSSGEITMDSTVLFATDSYDLSEEGRAYIDTFMGVYASVVLDEAYREVISEVRFDGHTDSSGTYEHNLELSENRAGAVMNYCLNESGSLDEAQKARLEEIAKAHGYSFSDLVYDENGEEDMDASRRVAIRFFVNIQ